MKFIHILLMIGITALWGTNFIAIKVSLESFPAFLQLALRFLLVGVPLIFFVKRPQGSWKTIFKFAFFLWILQMSFINLGLKYGIPAGIFSLLVQLKTVVILILSMVFYRYYPKQHEILGVFIALIGIAIIIANLITGEGGLEYLLAIPAIFSISLANLVFKNEVCADSPLTITVWCALITFFPMIMISLCFEGIYEIKYSFQHYTFISLISLLYVVFATLLATVSYVFLLNRYGPERIIPYTFLIPLFGLTTSYFVYGEQLNLYQAIAAAFILTGLFINQVSNPKKVFSFCVQMRSRLFQTKLLPKP